MEVPGHLGCSPEFWFDDGTVVLQVETTLYRVYRGLLAARSTVFRDTFSIPQPAEEKTEIGGCPVVRLHDKATDFNHFLKALHQYGSFPNCPVSGFAELDAILRLSDKYDVPALRASMLSILSCLYPTSLQTWSDGDRKTNSLTGYTSGPNDNILALNLAVTMDIRPVLPAIMYSICSRLQSEQILHGTYGRIHHETYRDRCLAAIPQLAVAQQNGRRYLTLNSGAECDDSPECNEERLRWLRIELGGSEPYSAPDPLFDENAKSWGNLGLCSSCLNAAKQSYNHGRQNLWDTLPVTFQLGTWDSLLA
ncbi:hypothetical protein DFH06DRAFT_1486902 [Mycena polygramma]|nr:hypothetical protein DFH06DRAFT_1486902 [Mycena polygramma]